MAGIAPHIGCLLVAVALTSTVFRIGGVHVAPMLAYLAIAVMALDAVGGDITAPVPQIWADRAGIIALCWAGVMILILMGRGLARIMADRRSLDIAR